MKQVDSENLSLLEIIMLSLLINTWSNYRKDLQPVIKVIIPAFNEENGVGQVIMEIPKDIVNEIVVVNNASTDQT